MLRRALIALLVLAAGPAGSAEAQPAGPGAALTAVATDAAARGDAAKALAYARRAAKAGDGAGLALLAEFHETGTGVPTDPATAVGLYRRAVQAGFHLAAARLGALYLDGAGVAADAKAARHWFRHFALLLPDMPDREEFIADWMAGRGVPEALRSAVVWAHRLHAAAAGERYEVSVQYRTGKGAPRDDAMAGHLLAGAFYQGVPAADFDYARVLLGNHASRSRIALGIDLLHSAASADIGEAQKALALRHLGGRDVKRSDSAALYWLRRAKANGADVGGPLFELERYISPEDRERTEWRIRNNYVPEVD